MRASAAVEDALQHELAFPQAPDAARRASTRGCSRPPGSRSPLREISGTRGAHVLEVRHAVHAAACAGTCRTASAAGRRRPRRGAAIGRSGVWKPVRTLFSRLAATCTSTVSTSVSKPARATRSTSGVIGLVVARQVGLEPRGRAASRRTCSSGVSDGAAQDHRDVGLRRGAREHEVAVVGGDRGAAHRRDAERRVVGAPEERRLLRASRTCRPARAARRRARRTPRGCRAATRSSPTPPEM